MWKKKKEDKMETPRVFWLFLCAGKITLKTQFYTVSVSWGLLDEGEEATCIFSQTLVLWYGLRRRKWHFFSTDKKKFPVCDIIVLGNLCFSRWQKRFESKEWVGDTQQVMTEASTWGSREPIMGGTVLRCCSRSDVSHITPSFQTEVSPHLHCLRLWHHYY